MTITYSQRWNFLGDQPIAPLTAEGARQYDEAGEAYAAALGDPQAPDRVLEITRPDHIGVWFFDPHQRRSLSYTFRRVGPRTMFLARLTRWVYPDDPALRRLNAAHTVETITYETGGIAHQVVRDLAAGGLRQTDFRDVSLDINAEPVPAFGDWGSIARYDRAGPAETY